MKSRVLFVTLFSCISLVAIFFWPKPGKSELPLTVEEVVRKKAVYRGREVFVGGYVSTVFGDTWFVGDEPLSEDNWYTNHIPILYFAPFEDEGALYEIPEKCEGQKVVVHGRFSENERTKTLHFSEVHTIMVVEKSDEFDSGSLCYKAPD